MSRRRTLSLSDLRGHIWAAGETKENPLKKAEEALGREWFAITAFPLFAGTFGPIATALNVCALVQPWRCEFAANEFQTDIKDIADPPWLIGINVVSLVFGVTANLAIMFVRSDKATRMEKYNLPLVLITIIGGGLASFILMALVIAASLHLRLPSPPDHAFTEAYYYAIMAAGLYFITSSFVIYTAYMLSLTRRSLHSLSHQFATGHRSLKILTIVFMAYILIGASIFSHIEGWRYLDGVFWADVTILTVGFGDFKPATHLGRSLLFPYAIFGVFILFLVVYCITQVVFERGKNLWEVRIRDQKRIKRVQERDEESRSKEQNDTQENGDTPATFEKPPLPHRRSIAREARRRDFNSMQSILRSSARRRILLSMALWGFFSLFLWLFGAALFYISERDQGWTYFTSLYFTFISLLAIGYGDNTLHSMSGKAIFVLWSLIVVPTLTMLITTGTEAVGMPFLSGTRAWLKRKLLGKETLPKIQKRLSSDKVRIETMNHNTHDKNHLLIQAIKEIARDHIKHQAANSRPEYSFEDWEYVFYLMDVLEPAERELEFMRGNGEREGGNDRDEDIPAVPQNNGNNHEEDLGESSVPRKRSKLELWTDGSNDQREGQMLDWLHGKNPLNVSETNTEWLLLTLVEKLEAELLVLRRRLGNTGGEEG